MSTRRLSSFAIWFGLWLLLLSPPAWSQKVQIHAMYSDQGVLWDFRPTGVEWLDKDQLLVVDRHYGAFQIFGTDGHRRAYMVDPRDLPPARYSGVCRLRHDTFFVTGSHYDKDNTHRYVWARSAIRKVVVRADHLAPNLSTDNYSPIQALQATRLYGYTPRKQMEISGIAMDPKHNRVFLSLSRPLSQRGTVIIYTGPLDKFLARDRSFHLQVVKSELKPPIAPTCDSTFYCSDIAYVPGRGLVLLLTADADHGRRFCSNQIWLMPGGVRPARLLMRGIAPHNRATGIALAAEGHWYYKVALVCDNNPARTHVPPRLVILDHVRLRLR